MGPGIKAKCRQCGKEAAADSFKLHYKYRMMVCPDCFSGKTEKQREEKLKAEVQPVHPAGWDKEDEYLEKASRMKVKEVPQYKRIPGSDLVQMSCKNCNYTFKYDSSKQSPRTCPYCDCEVPKVNIYNSF